MKHAIVVQHLVCCMVKDLKHTESRHPDPVRRLGGHGGRAVGRPKSISQQEAPLTTATAENGTWARRGRPSTASRWRSSSRMTPSRNGSARRLRRSCGETNYVPYCSSAVRVPFLEHGYFYDSDCDIFVACSMILRMSALSQLKHCVSYFRMQDTVARCCSGCVIITNK